MATMQQAGTEMREFAHEFEWHTQDANMAKEDGVHLVLGLHQDTLTHLDAYVTIFGGDKMAHLETIQGRLCHILYIQMLVYLKQGKLSELAR